VGSEPTCPANPVTIRYVVSPEIVLKVTNKAATYVDSIINERGLVDCSARKGKYVDCGSGYCSGICPNM